MGDVKSLNQDIESKKLQSVYVFTGEEQGLITQYVNEIKTGFKTVIETDNIDQVIEDCKYNPIFGGGKLFILRNTGLFQKQVDNKFVNFLAKMFKQKMNICIFVESEVDGKLRQVQALGDKGLINFKRLTEEQLIGFVNQVLAKNGKRMVKDLTRYFVDQCDYDYNTIINELTKILNYVDTKEIKVDDVKHVVTQSSRSIVFDLVDYIVKQKYQRAVDMYYTLLNKKEHPLVILTLIYRQLKLLYQIKLLRAEGYRVNDIADACDSKPFIIEKSMNICSFDTEKLLKLMLKCSEMDWKIKTGQIKDTLAIECLILYSSMRTLQ